jgi:chaperonin GroES
VGDVVLFTKWGGTEVKIDGKEITILKESDILAILDKSTSAKAA